MIITPKPQPDPVSKMHITDAYFRWALFAAEEVAGKHGLDIVLRDSGLSHLVDHYPEEVTAVSGKYTYEEYAQLSTGLLNFFGRGAKSMTLRIGRISTRKAIDQQSVLFGIAALLAAKLLPVPTKLKMGLDAQLNGFKKLSKEVGEEYIGYVEDRGDRFALCIETCAMCAGKHADQPICFLYTGTLQESTTWLTGKQFDIQEVECRALGAKACVWEILKAPKE